MNDQTHYHNGKHPVDNEVCAELSQTDLPHGGGLPRFSVFCFFCQQSVDVKREAL